MPRQRHAAEPIASLKDSVLQTRRITRQLVDVLRSRKARRSSSVGLFTPTAPTPSIPRRIVPTTVVDRRLQPLNGRAGQLSNTDLRISGLPKSVKQFVSANSIAAEHSSVARLQSSRSHRSAKHQTVSTRATLSLAPINPPTCDQVGLSELYRPSPSGTISA